MKRRLLEMLVIATDGRVAATFKELAPGLRSPIAVFSDVGGNCEALDAVLLAIRCARIQQIICLGDSIGFCASPDQCLKRVQESATICLKGRLDQLLLRSIFSGQPYEGSLSERDARIMTWTEQQVCPGARAGFNTLSSEGQVRDSVLGRVISQFKNRGARDVLDWLRALPEQYRSGASQFCHQVKSEGLRLTLQLTDRVRALAGFDSGVDYLFLGANHRQWLVQVKNGATLSDAVSSDVRLQVAMEVVYSGPVTARGVSNLESCSIIELAPTTKSIISVGSVGQPRDGDPRAAFVIFDVGRVYFCRVAYDVDAAMAKASGISAFGEHGLVRLATAV